MGILAGGRGGGEVTPERGGGYGITEGYINLIQLYIITGRQLYIVYRACIVWIRYLLTSESSSVYSTSRSLSSYDYFGQSYNYCRLNICLEACVHYTIKFEISFFVSMSVSFFTNAVLKNRHFDFGKIRHIGDLIRQP